MRRWVKSCNRDGGEGLESVVDSMETSWFAVPVVVVVVVFVVCVGNCAENKLCM